MDGIMELFEFKPDPVEFLNSPLFLIVVIIGIVIFFAVKKTLKKRKEKISNDEDEDVETKTKKKIRFRKEPKKAEIRIVQDEPDDADFIEERQKIVEPEQVISRPSSVKKFTHDKYSDESRKAIVDDIIQSLPGHGVKEVVVESEPVKTVEPSITDEKIKLAAKEALYAVLKDVAKNGDNVKTVDEKPSDYQHIQKTPEYKEYPSKQEQPVDVKDLNLLSEEAFLAEIKKLTSDIKSVEDHIDKMGVLVKETKDVNIEEKVDKTLDEVKKKPNFLSSILSLFSSGDRKVEGDGEKVKEESGQPVVDMPKTYYEKIVESGEKSKRQVVKELCDRGKTEDDIYDITGWDQSMIRRYYAEWEKEQFKMIKDALPNVNLKTVGKIFEFMSKGEPVIVEGNKLYFQGRDKMTYIFIGTSLIELVIIAFMI